MAVTKPPVGTCKKNNLGSDGRGLSLIASTAIKGSAMHYPGKPSSDLQASTNFMQASVNRLADATEDHFSHLPSHHPLMRAALQLQRNWAALALALRDSGVEIPRCEHDEGWPRESPR